MKKSKLYELAQIAVVENNKLPATVKIDIIHELMEKQGIELFRENHYGESEDTANAEN